jgi:hypothetical protein
MNFAGPQGAPWLRKPAELSGEREDLAINKNAEKQVEYI